MNINQKIIIHLVGQGFFYSFQLKVYWRSRIEKFRFVFDCGTLNVERGRDEIRHYHEEHLSENEELDLLVISHFDKDHVNLIGELLDNRRVKRIMAPFLPYKERMALLVKFLEASNEDENNEDNDFFINLLIDPERTLINYISEDGEIIFVTSGRDNPLFPSDEINEIPPINPDEDNQRLFFNFDFRNYLENLSPENAANENISNTGSKVKYMQDCNFPTLKFGDIKLMDFLFYRKKIGEDEQAFYEAVYKKFKSHFFSNNKQELTQQDLTNAIKSIKSAKEIKEFYKEAKKNLNFNAYKGLDIVNPNTTALCLLHLNKKILNTVENNFYYILEVVRVQRFEGIKKRIKTPHLSNIENYYCYITKDQNSRKFRLPNTLLTSDSFLLKPKDVEEFSKRYKNQLENLLLFQIPHHGSKKNMDTHLLSKLPFHVVPFTNYGVNNRWNHPSEQLINDLVSTKHSEKFIAINEFSGLELDFTKENIPGMNNNDFLSGFL